MNPYPIIDIGANLCNRRFDSDLPAVLQRAKKNGIAHIIVTGTNVAVSEHACALAKQHRDFLSSTAGVHPHDAKTWGPATAQKLLVLLNQKPVVAAGECGLDFNRNFSTPAEQQTCFSAQLEIATSVKKPVFLHERDAHSRFYEILCDYQPRLTGSVVHCFTGDRQALFRYLDLGCYIGITGWICDHRRGQPLRELVPHIPKDRLLIETDAPYLTPHGLPEKPANNRNEPALLPVVLHTLADLYGADPAELAAQTLDNSNSFFSLG